MPTSILFKSVVLDFKMRVKKVSFDQLVKHSWDIKLELARWAPNSKQKPITKKKQTIQTSKIWLD